jgi:hypothetical protein
MAHELAQHYILIGKMVREMARSFHTYVIDIVRIRPEEQQRQIIHRFPYFPVSTGTHCVLRELMEGHEAQPYIHSNYYILRMHNGCLYLVVVALALALFCHGLDVPTLGSTRPA